MNRKKASMRVRSRAMPTKKKYAMRLYVTGATPKSSRAIMNLRKLCDEYLPGRYELTVIDMGVAPVT